MHSWRNTEVTWLFAIGAGQPRCQRFTGNGIAPTKSGTDFIVAPGTTGVHLSRDSLPRDGPGTMATGIMKDSSSNSTTVFGSDSKEEIGSNMESQCQSNQKPHMKKQSVGHSTNWKRLASLPHSQPKICLGVLLDLVRIEQYTFGKDTQLADSSEENSAIKKSISVRKDKTMSGNLLKYALEEQSWPEMDSTTSMAVQ